MMFSCCPQVFAQQLFLAPPPTPKLDPLSEFFDVGPPPDAAAVQRGKAIFTVNCSFCHGANASGGNTGPSLVQSTIVLRDRGSGEALGNVVRAGRQGKGMPSFALNDAQISDIAAFLFSRYQSVTNRTTYRLGNLLTGDARAGEAYFKLNCTGCHPRDKDLAHVASKWDPPTLQRKFLYPADALDSSDSVAASATLTLPSGEILRGKLMFQDDFRVILLVNGRNRVIDFDDGSDYHLAVENPLAGHEALLPRYSDADMHNILAYLETMR
jgi:mono/diheme cytochrome c family protein